MSWFRLFVSSSLGKKYLMGITGLLLCGFLVTHLAGNLLMYVSSDVYNTYAHTLHSQEWFVKSAEVGLLAIFVLHLVLAFNLSRNNSGARPVGYLVEKSKEGSESAPLSVDTWMLLSGIAVLIFLVVHLSDFHFGTSADIYDPEEAAEMESFEKAIHVLRQPSRLLIYIGGAIFLCAHLMHGFSSAFRSLGVSHPKYNRCIRIFGYFFAVIFGFGFATFPVWATFFR